MGTGGQSAWDARLPAGSAVRAALLAFGLGAIHNAKVPSTDVKWIVGTLGGLLLVLGGLLVSQNAGLRAELAELRTDVRRLDDDVRRLDDRLRAVEVSLGQLTQRLLALERVMLPAAVQEPAP